MSKIFYKVNGKNEKSDAEKTAPDQTRAADEISNSVDARICSILRNLAADGVEPRPCTLEELALLEAPEELELIRLLSGYTDEVTGAARSMDPARITRYVVNVSTLFHKFYNTCRVKGVEPALSAARLQLCASAKTVLENALALFKVTAPESM